eukprot:3936918-Rhodomonas_salina.1
MTPAGGTCVPGFYAGYVGFLRWAATTAPSLMAARSAQFRPDTVLASPHHSPAPHAPRYPGGAGPSNTSAECPLYTPFAKGSHCTVDAALGTAPSGHPGGTGGVQAGRPAVGAVHAG